MSCRSCPAAFVIHGATRSEGLVLCRIESTERGQADGGSGPVSLIRPTTSPASFYGYCLGALPDFVELADALGAAGLTDEERRIAAAARRSGADPDHRECPSWRAERDSRAARKLVDLPSRERRVLEAGRA